MEVNFSVESGIEIQNNHLNKWKQLLYPKVYIALEIYAKRYNDKAINGYEIRRGETLTTFIHNFLYYEEKNHLKEVLGNKGFKMYLKELHRL